MEIIAEIQRQMAEIYCMFYLPRLAVNMETNQVSIIHEWTNKEAKQTYENLQEALSFLIILSTHW